jgi:hypothetical protein
MGFISNGYIACSIMSKKEIISFAGKWMQLMQEKDKKERKGVGEHDQSTLYACMKISQ